MEKPIENVDAVEFVNSDITDTIKKIRCRNKKRPDETCIVNYYVKVILIAMWQPSVKGLLTWKIKIKS